MNEKYLPFFCYGTLMRGFANHERIVRGKANYIRPASSIGTMFSVNNHFPALITKGDNDIDGELIFIDPKVYDLALQQMDNLEGYRKDDKEHSMYIRRSTKVLDNESGEVVTAWVYYWNRPYKGLEFVESGSWVEYVKRRDGGRSWN